MCIKQFEQHSIQIMIHVHMWGGDSFFRQWSEFEFPCGSPACDRRVHHTQSTSNSLLVFVTCSTGCVDLISARLFIPETTCLIPYIAQPLSSYVLSIKTELPIQSCSFSSGLLSLSILSQAASQSIHNLLLVFPEFSVFKFDLHFLEKGFTITQGLITPHHLQ